MNKDAVLIRNMINIYESVEKKIISNTIVKTNNYILNEDFISKLVQKEISAVSQADRSVILSKLSAEFKGFFDGMLKNSELAAKLDAAAIRTSDELVTAIASNFKNVPTELSGSLKGGLELTILKSNTTNTKLIEAASENLINNKTFLSKYADDINKGQPAFESALTNSKNYSKNSITKIVEKVNTKYGMKVDKSKLPKLKDAKPKDPKPKDVDPVPKPNDTWWDNLRRIGWIKAASAAAGVGIALFLLWYWFKQNKIEDKDIPDKPPIDPNNEWAPCLVKILENKKGMVIRVTSGRFVVKVINDTYPEGVLFFTDGKVLTNNGKRKGTWRCKDGQVQPIDEQSTSNNLSIDAESVVDYLKGNVITTIGLERIENILNKYIKSGQGKQFLDTYKKISGGFLENTLQSKTTITDPSKRAIRDRIYSQIRKMKGGGGTSTGDSLSGIEIIWDDNKKKDKETPIPIPIKKDMYVDCPNFPLYFGCKGTLVSELQTCLKMTGVDGKLGPNTKATAESWGKSNNIELKEKFPGGGERFEVTEENFKKICGGKPVPIKDKDPVIPEPIKDKDPVIPEPIKDKDPVIPDPIKDKDPIKPTNIKDPGQELYKRLRDERSLIYKEGMFGGGDRKAVYRGGELSDDDEKLLRDYMGEMNYSLSQENEDYRKGDKLVFKKIRKK